MTTRLLREAIAAYAHAAWSGWMDYIFSKCLLQPDGSLIIPSEYVQRWSRQKNTLYKDLPEQEKESDRAEADKVLVLLTLEEEGEL